MTLCVRWVMAIILATVVAWLALGLIVAFLRRPLCKRPYKTEFCESLGRLDFAVGSTERLIAMILFVFAQSYFVPFIGGWLALKYVAGWHEKYEPFGRDIVLIALVGTAWSFAFAIGAACVICPQSLTHFMEYAAHGTK
jgi:hypothetical protein